MNNTCAYRRLRLQPRRLLPGATQPSSYLTFTPEPGGPLRPGSRTQRCVQRRGQLGVTTLRFTSSCPRHRQCSKADLRPSCPGRVLRHLPAARRRRNPQPERNRKVASDWPVAEPWLTQFLSKDCQSSCV